jgi:hypothetical protein
MAVDITQALIEKDASALLRALVEEPQSHDAIEAARLFLAETVDHKTVTLSSRQWASITDLVYAGSQADDFALTPGVVEQTTDDDKEAMAAVDALGVQLYGKPFAFKA